MTEGGILRHLIAFSLPLLLGNIFQMLYNTVDSIVVGKFVGKEALAAVGATLYVHCQSGLRSYLACRILAQYGYPCANVAGGYVFYQAMRTDADARDAGVGPCGA